MSVQAISKAEAEVLTTIQIMPLDESSNHPFALLRTSEGSSIRVDSEGIHFGYFEGFKHVQSQWPIEDACFVATEHGISLDFSQRWPGSRQMLVRLTSERHRKEATMFVREAHLILSANALRSFLASRG